MKPTVIAYILKGFPRISETFIANEVRLLTHFGLQLKLFSIKHGDELAADDTLPPATYLPQVTSLSNTNLPLWLLRNFSSFVTSQSYLIRKQPLRYVKTLAFAWRCAIKYRDRSRTQIKKTFIKEFLFATYISVDILKAECFCHIHAHFCHDATTVAWMTSMLTGLPFTFTAHAKDIYQKKLNPGDLLQRKLQAATFTVTCTDANVAYLRNKSQEPDKVYRIYHGLNTNVFVPPNPSVTPSHVKLLSIGRLVEKKGFYFLVEACRILRVRGVVFQLDILGEPGDQSDAISTAIDRYELDDYVHILPPISQHGLIEYYQSATAFVLPCIVLENGDRDGIPNVMAEAMASGLPVIVTGISGIPELVAHEVNGIISPPANPKHWQMLSRGF